MPHSLTLRLALFRLHLALAWLLTPLALLVGAGRAEAAPSPTVDPDPLALATVPDALRPWIPWALYGQEMTFRCPLLSGSEQRKCAWPGTLVLELGERGGSFRQDWHLDAKATIPLPGDAKRWPLDVEVDGRAAPVFEGSEGRPVVEMAPGSHSLRGSFAWDSLPESLQLPSELAMLELRVRGARVSLPARDATGLIWLQKAASEEAAVEEGDALAFAAYRKATDDVPFLLETMLELHVSGAKREELLGKALPPGFVPLSLSSELPVRLEPDGRLRVQVRAGTFTVTLVGRSEGPVEALARPAPDGPWPTQEIWVFEARPALRVVTVEGAASIDPQQTTLPSGWRNLPAYPMTLDDKLRFVEQRRGEAAPPPNALTLSRRLWLDFDGEGFTVSDRLAGTLNRGTRIDLQPPAVLGRVSVNGKDQLITRLGDAGPPGVEVHSGSLEVNATSRLPASRDLSAVGWAADFDRLDAMLFLPPGWRLLHASGADVEAGAWLRSWSLWRLFLALVLAISITRLWRLGWGVVALALFLLTFPERDAVIWLWLGVPVTEALWRAVSSRRVRPWLQGLRVGALVVVSLLALPFAVAQLREGLHPALALPVEAEYERAGHGMAEGPSFANADAELPEGGIQLGSIGTYGDGRGLEGKEEMLGEAGAPRKPSRSKSKKFDYGALDPSAIVQTGPGLPSWSWSAVQLGWTGPVLASQQLELYLTDPTTNLALAVLRVALLTALLVRLWLGLRRPGGHGAPKTRKGGAGGPAPRATVAAALCLGVALALSPPARAGEEFPGSELLGELRSRLLPSAACGSSCVTSPRLALELTGERLRLRFTVDAAAPGAVPLPTLGGDWAPDSALVDGQAAAGVLRVDDTLWVAVPMGRHEIALSGALPERDTLQLALPLKPHRVEVVAARGWTVEGLHPDGLADDRLQLVRIARRVPSAPSAPGAPSADSAGLAPSELPPFVRVERTLQLGLQWSVTTRVTRVSPTGAAILLEVPLIAGENVTTADLRVVEGKALVNLGPADQELEWVSTLEERSPLALTAPRSLAWVEEWRAEIALVWDPTFGGIPQVERTTRGEAPTWRPWPGEEVTLALARPAAVPGQSLTIDSSKLLASPGARAVDVQLEFGLRSSRGTDHSLVLPEGALVQSLSLDGAPQPIRQEGRRVTFAVEPGARRVALTWREDSERGAWFETPEVDLGAPSVNASVIVEVPTDRWVLFTGGPRLGPAVLFWSFLIVLLVLSLGLGRVRWTPLRWWQWWLLGVGLSQTAWPLAALFAGWLFLLGWRARTGSDELPRFLFNLRQLALVGATAVALGILVFALREGLLGSPSMQVEGNGSSEFTLRWFADRADATLPRAWVVSVPLLVYRGVMLAWALWMASALLGWLRWGWRAFATGGLWHRGPARSKAQPRPPWQKATEADEAPGDAAASDANAPPVEALAPESPVETGETVETIETDAPQDDAEPRDKAQSDKES